MRHMPQLKSQRGAALVEAAMTIPLLLLISVGIFEFGRAYQTWQVLTNAAREAARVAVLPGATAGTAQARATEYMKAGQLSRAADATVTVQPATIDMGGGVTAGASHVTVDYPFDFIVLQPVAQLVVKGSKAGSSLTMSVSAVMRNE